jgi:predicted DCC family thiol-disulfide oxidoreductase YuxK
MPETGSRDKPLVIFDGRCGFCRIWIEYWKEVTGDRVEYAPSQEVAGEFPQIPRESFTKSVQLAMPSGEVLSGARAVCQLLTYATGKGWPLRLYDGIPGLGPALELVYRFIAAHRGLSHWITVVLFGRRVRPASFRRIEWLFLRLLALIYLIAFVSLGVQVRGLIGSHGILPLGDYLDAAASAVGPWRAWRLLPSIFWLAHGDGVLTGSCIVGAVAAVVLLLGFYQRSCLIVMFVLYLSLCSAGQDFLSFQWDMLLLEAGFLAIFLGSSNLVVWLFRLLVFRLMFSSGAVKLLSGDPTWRSLRAMSFHYFTQPIPTPIAWYMQQLPFWFQKYSTMGVFCIELVMPLFIFLPRRLRFCGGLGLIFLQVLILTTGNYAFFNWLSIALCLFLFDDHALPAWLPAGAATRVTPRRVAIAAAVLVIGLGALQMMATFGVTLRGPASGIVRLTAPFGIVNTYGLFAVMTTTRLEITVQGSNDGVTWSDYEFAYKPGPLDRRPPWVAPHQPRLDWQMWFAALSTYRNNPWFVNFMVRLLEGSPEVSRLMRINPFPRTPPRYVRTLISSYQFTDQEERRETGDWWKAEPSGVYLRAISLADVRR